MIFNGFLWNNFKESQYGQEVLNFFSNYEVNIGNQNRESYHKIIRLIDFDTRSGGDYWDNFDNYSELVKDLIQDIKGFFEEDGCIIIGNTSSKIVSIDDAANLYSAVLDEQSRVFEPFTYDNIQFFADGFYIAYPDYFFPLLFFPVLLSSCCNI